MKIYIFFTIVMGILASPLVLADSYHTSTATDNSYSNGLEQGFDGDQDLNSNPSINSNNSNSLDGGISRDGETMGEED